jgi:O-antigen/teichoic acid export membrane protein
VLKGAGSHRLLATSNLVMAFANLGLSIVLVRKAGLIGVALGTLIPLGIVSILVLFPAACRRAGVSITRALASAVWPAVWPMIPMAILLAVTRNFLGASLPAIAMQAILAGSIYALVFLRLAIGRAERHWYFDKIKQILRRPREAVAV